MSICNNSESQTTLQQKCVSSPTKYAFPKRSFKSLPNSPNKDEFYLISNLKRDVMVNVFTIRPRQNNLRHLCTVSTENLENIYIN